MSKDQNRRSKRQPVPNPYYYRGIVELKKDNDQRTTKTKKGHKNGDDDYGSYEESQPQYFNSQCSDNQEQYLPCILPDGYHRKIQFIVKTDKQEQAPIKKQMKPTQKVTKKPQAPVSSLLDIFKEAIRNPDIIGQNGEPDEPRPTYEKQTHLVTNTKKIRDKPEGYIQQLQVSQSQIKIVHSQLGNVQVPIQWSKPDPIQKQMTEEQIQLAKKLEKYKDLDKISILSTL